MAVILVVDDDEGVRTSLCELLEDEGHVALRASNGREALDALHGGARPDLIFLDLMMPEMDGWAFRTEQLRDPDLRGIPVVVITAGGPNTAATVDAAVILHKPFAGDQILDLVDQLAG